MKRGFPLVATMAILLFFFVTMVAAAEDPFAGINPPAPTPGSTPTSTPTTPAPYPTTPYVTETPTPAPTSTTTPTTTTSPPANTTPSGGSSGSAGSGSATTQTTAPTTSSNSAPPATTTTSAPETAAPNTEEPATTTAKENDVLLYSLFGVIGILVITVGGLMMSLVHKHDHELAPATAALLHEEAPYRAQMRTSFSEVSTMHVETSPLVHHPSVDQARGFAQTLRDRGYGDAQIRDHFVSHGWSEEQAAMAMRRL